MATRTGRLVMDRKTGEMVEEMKEDQMMVALYDPSCESPAAHTFQRVLRSDFKLRRINELFNCNAAYLKDPFGNVLWPKDWMTQVLPPMGKDNWFYIIHERLEPAPQDDLRDPFYAGATILVLTGVPKQCEAVDLQHWLLFGIAQDFDALSRVKDEIKMSERKRLVLKQKMNALPSMDVEGSAQQQTELRKKLTDAIASHLSKYDSELAALGRRKARIERLLLTEPLQLTPLPIDKPVMASNDRTESMDEYEKRVETRSWMVAFTSSRGTELATVALQKSDWNYVCLVQTRPQPKAFIEDDQVQQQIISAKELEREINMRTVRLRRLRHGTGELLQMKADSEDRETRPAPSDEDFHISSIGAMYNGEWRMGEKHGRGREYTNVGIYEGEFERNLRRGRGKTVYGKGTTIVGTYGPPSRRYEYSAKIKDTMYPQSVLNGEAFRDGIEHGDRMTITFPDGATYEGEMTDGKITGYGKYTSSTGVVDEGFFRDGLLQGENCRRTFPDGTIQRGTFVDGELHGRGLLRERNGDEYDGFFDVGDKSGRGTAYFDKRRCKHVGFWFENMMNGRGDCFFKADDALVREMPPEEDEDWDFQYEGSFLQGKTQARHRHIDLKKKHPGHLPFTTNGKSEEKMPFLTLVLPDELAKRERRRHKNSVRRWNREREYLQKQEYENLSLYFSLLDDYYEKWAEAQRNAKADAELTEEELDRRQQFRKERYNISPRKRELGAFESYLERVTLTERVKLQRAMTGELSAMVDEIKKVASNTK
ncbi:hypothetical protein P43SY_000373 [Pythium insidiosum]|uniref:Uncharacterized protein n=1 Tax=Pythium insidiosum TaxID=114742 RepID=A0AAD5MFS1_PYTIN|nr:hypothetical protein P43SY_000373 [Pythium insidiosum]